jgi:hypothetical protein
MFKRYLMHEKLIFRFGSLLGVVLVIFLCAWTFSYLILPEGILRGRSVGQVLAGNDLAGGSVWLEWLRIFAINLSVMFVIVIVPNVLRTEHDFPLGYITAIIIAIYYAVTLGTDSFTLSQGGKIFPSLAILGRSGPYEITAYILATTATYSIAKFRLKGRWPKQTSEVIVSTHIFRLTREQWIGLLLAIAILLVSNGWEAYRIMLYLAV